MSRLLFVEIPVYVVILNTNYRLLFTGTHVSHLESTDEEELNRLLRIVVDVENLFLCVHREEDAETKQVYFYLFRVRAHSVVT